VKEERGGVSAKARREWKERAKERVKESEEEQRWEESDDGRKDWN
jgi:hypothetical protein